MKLFILLSLTVVLYYASGMFYFWANRIWPGVIMGFNAVVYTGALFTKVDYSPLVVMGLIIALANFGLALMAKDPADDPERRTVTGR